MLSILTIVVTLPMPAPGITTTKISPTLDATAHYLLKILVINGSTNPPVALQIAVKAALVLRAETNAEYSMDFLHCYQTDEG